MIRITLTMAATVLIALAAGCKADPAPAGHAACSGTGAPMPSGESEAMEMSDKVVKTDEEWRAQLTPEQYRVLRQKGTERPFTGDHYENESDGTYTCAGCGFALFTSDAKYRSDCGWPSFSRPVADTSVDTRPDNSLSMRRTEVLCPRCGGHLGHVFKDGPAPTGLRYCINSVALEFKPEGEE